MPQKSTPVVVFVNGNDIERALKKLKKGMQTAGIIREIKLRMYYEKPCDKRRRKANEAVRRIARARKKAALRECELTPREKR
jgi:small subunit ribosomal protein S21